MQVLKDSPYLPGTPRVLLSSLIMARFRKFPSTGLSKRMLTRNSADFIRRWKRPATS